MHCAIYACCSGTPRSIFEKTMVWPKLRCQQGGHNGKLSTSNQTSLTTISQRVQIYQFAMNIQSSSESRSIDIDLLACALLFGGGTGMAGALVSPELGLQPWLLFRTEAMSGLMVLVGLGLLMRLDWAFCRRRLDVRRVRAVHPPLDAVRPGSGLAVLCAGSPPA